MSDEDALGSLPESHCGLLSLLPVLTQLGHRDVGTPDYTRRGQPVNDDSCYRRKVREVFQRRPAEDDGGQGSSPEGDASGTVDENSDGSAPFALRDGLFPETRKEKAVQVRSRQSPPASESEDCQ